MQLQTILNLVQPFKSFVYESVRVVQKKSGPTLEVKIRPRVNGKPICSACGRPGPGYDRESEPRRFEFVPLWGMAVFFLYAMHGSIALAVGSRSNKCRGRKARIT